jgi:glycosyltransferase involved in cell wall biosynthesis
MVGESSHLPSGFGNYTREILQRLYDTNKYEIAELSCYRHNKIPKNEGWKVYPGAVDSTHPLYMEYQSNTLNQFGKWRFDIAVVDFKPHIVIDVRDFWYFAYQEMSPLRQFFHWIVAPTHDSSPPKIEAVNVFKNADMVLFHTNWAKQDIIKYNIDNNINIGDVVSDAVDPNIFKPLDKIQIKREFKIDPNTTVIGSVMRNQKRKLICDLFQVISDLIHKDNENIILYLHSTFPENNGWNIPSMLLEYNIANNVLLTYRCSSCHNFFPSYWHGISQKCTKCGSKASICTPNNSVSTDELCKIYNSFDIYIQYAVCEGFGIPHAEAAACALPIITVNHGAMAEVGQNIGARLVDVRSIYREHDIEADRALPNNSQCYMIISSMLKMTKDELVTEGLNNRSLVLEKYTWDKTAKVFEKIIDDIDISKKLDWNCEIRTISNISINNDINNRDFVYAILDAIGDSHLKNTNFIQQMIKDLDVGIIINGSVIQNFGKEQAIKILETYAINKLGLEKVRCGLQDMPDKIKDFLSYS